MKRLLSILLFIPIFVISQYTAIPDQNFEQALIDEGHDDVIDGQVLTPMIDTVTFMYLQYRNISDLTGIKDFTALTSLDCGSNSLTSLEISQNTALKSLYCDGNQLTSLDVSNNTALTELFCNGNQLASLDVSQNTALTDLHCPYNQLTSLDVSQNTALTGLDCRDNQLNCLNLKNVYNTNITYFRAYLNPNLTCIEVDDPNWATLNWTNIDSGVTFSTNCNYPAGCF
jgi:Leucine-rich repeat (LRR) protein